MKIGIIGQGKMGLAIEKLAERHGAEVVWSVGKSDWAALSGARLAEADVAIEFTRPDAAFENVVRCLRSGLPVVCGTTGWQDRLAEAQALCRTLSGAMLWASNFSIGVNLFFELNRKLADLMEKWPDYRPEIFEIHHIHKLDAPSGTAISLAEQILERRAKLSGWSSAPAADRLLIRSERTGEVPGTHGIEWRGPIDRIRIEHEAFSRDGFASGALMAARFLKGKTGIFTMRDLIF